MLELVRAFLMVNGQIVVALGILPNGTNAEWLGPLGHPKMESRINKRETPSNVPPLNGR
jgi:hypothetical protein